MEHIFDAKAIEALGKRIVQVGSEAPEWLVTRTPLMSVVFRSMIRLADTAGKTRQQYDVNRRLAERLVFQDAQHNMPGMAWGHRGSFRFPIVLATWKQRVEYFSERRPVQVLPQMLAQVDHIFRQRSLPPAVLPTGKLLWWLRNSLLNSPAHWYVQQVPGALELDFASICNAVDHESSDCKYNIRDIRLTDARELTINARTPLKSVEQLTGSESDTDRRPLEHSVFLTLTLLQQATEVCYHNWIHFYFNDLVLFNLQNHFPAGHWVRRLMDPHMRYQNVLNNAGLYSRVPNDVRPYEVFDDILFGGNLSSWTLDTFQTSIIDRTLGYYQKADLSEASLDTRRLDFNLNRLPTVMNDQMGGLVQELDKDVADFVGTVIDHCASDADERLMALVSENVLKFLHPDCLRGIDPANDTVRGVFKLILSRYLLQAGLLHGIEHFSMYFWFAPLRLPQRIRRMFDIRLGFEDYSYPIDKQNGAFGHDMFTRYVPGPDNLWNWETLQYGFEDPALERISEEFVETIRQALQAYDARVLKPAREVLDDHGIPYTDGCVMTPDRVGCSICL